MKNASTNESTFSRGDKIRVKKGSEIISTNPKSHRRSAPRNFTVTCFAFDPSFAGADGYTARASKVTWIGTGGYWCSTDASNVELATK